MDQNTDNTIEADKLWESLILEKFPNSSKKQISESRYNAAVSWMFEEKTVMSEIYDKFVMMKRLRGL